MQVNLISNSKVSILVNGKTKVLALGDQAIRQGGSFSISFSYEGDYSSWSPKSQIRNNYLVNNGLILAEFSFLPLAYNSITDKTTITLSLKADITSSLPITNYQGSENVTPTVNNCLVYDVELIDPNDITNVIKLVDPSFIQVIPEVTLQ